MAQQNPKSQNLSSDDTEAERQAKIDAAAERERKAQEKATEEKRKADEKAAKEAEKAAHVKGTAAHPQVSAGGSEPPAGKDAEKTSHRPSETVKAGQSGKGAGVRSSKLSRRDMEDVIKQGGSVMYNGVILTHVGHLPPEADLVAGDEEAEKRVAEELEAEIETKQKLLAKLRK